MNRIKELRIKRGMTQKELSRVLNCAPTAVSKYELEQLGIDSDKINVLCEIFGCTADYLLCRSETPTPELSPEEERLLVAWRRSPPEIRAIIDAALAPYSQSAIESSTA
ncbi:MAG: helix-turn-helix transcriptional regulator [Oscillospiraceae bacterium]|nr:helix-turn-helix transcriptional regulator [Oscillospiraceae bacterium]